MSVSIGDSVKILGIMETTYVNYDYLRWIFNDGLTLPNNVVLSRTSRGIDLHIHHVNIQNFGTYRFEYYDKINHYILYDIGKLYISNTRKENIFNKKNNFTRITSKFSMAT